MKITFCKSEETAKVANEISAQYKGSLLQMSDYQCDCGQSFAINILDGKTLDTIEKVVECDACYKNEN